VEDFINATLARDYPRAAQYLDLRALPSGTHAAQGAERARQLQIVLERTLWIDLTALSPLPEGRMDDGLPPFRERVGTITTEEQTFDLLLQRVSHPDGGPIW
jgi:MscS family membrane protein